MPLGREVGLGPDSIVLDGDPAPPKRGTADPTFRPVSIVAKRLPVSATAKLVFVFIWCCSTFLLTGECVLLLSHFACRRRREIVVMRVCLSAAACLYYCTDPNVTWGSGWDAPLVVHYWADLQSVHGLRCYGNITRTVVTSANAKC